MKKKIICSYNLAKICMQYIQEKINSLINATFRIQATLLVTAYGTQQAQHETQRVLVHDPVRNIKERK